MASASTPRANPAGFATTALKLAEYRKLRPGAWEEKIFCDHPSGYTRILTVMRWQAERLAEAQIPARPRRNNPAG